MHETLYRIVREHHNKHKKTLFVARMNHVLLDLLLGTFNETVEDIRVRWISPNIFQTVCAIQAYGTERPGCTIADYHRYVDTTLALTNPDRTLLRILEIAQKLEGPHTSVHESKWITYLRDILRPEDSAEEENTLTLYVATAQLFSWSSITNSPQIKQLFVSTR